ncbi:asparaginase [Altererythrobacter lutimaris]|uniref:Asparaginase n=1 Tax=Altererythrobacter lutimaris TaxID=2743979 RepID=A0A850HC95_9SPHN|nr:asparaginase [Altererythrobacter lutimaris]NVE94651.1 asparaginase [Altererythrobacter lutimaris]
MSSAANILILATGGTIAGTAGSALKRDYRPGQIGISTFIEQAESLGLDANLTGQEIAAIGSEDITPEIWRSLYRACSNAMVNEGIDGIIITHGTDTAEETALLLDLTLPTTKPVVLVGAMRPADAVGTDGIRNFLNAVRVASDPDAAGRGVLLVMSDRIISARDARKAKTSGVDAFKGFPRDAVGTVTPSSLDWFGEPWAKGRAARYAMPTDFPHVPILYAHAAMDRSAVDCLLTDQTRGLVLAGFGDGNAPEAIFDRLAELAEAGISIVRASRVDEGLVDRIPLDSQHGFVAARGLGPAKARILLQVLLANGISAPEEIQAAFDKR